jgi:hypothetical protein
MSATLLPGRLVIEEEELEFLERYFEDKSELWIPDGPIAMAQMVPTAGLDVILGQFPKNDTRLTSLFLGLFTSQTASTVITSGQNGTNITEATFTNYAAQTLATATWGAQAGVTNGRGTTYPQVTFPTAGSAQTVNGFFVKTANAALSATNLVGQANFDDTTAVPLAANDVIKVTPTFAQLYQ